jgi:hypothetical protein
MIDTLWAECEVKRKTLPYTSLELMSILERALNFAHTGNTRVLCKEAMQYMGIAQALVQDGMPTFWPGLRFKILDSIPGIIPYILLPEWPLDENSKTPHLPSRRSVVYNYGHQHLQVSGCL